MNLIYIFAAGVGLGAVLMASVLLPLIFNSHKFMAYRNPADMLFYEYEMKRLKSDRKTWWKFELPKLTKKVNPAKKQPDVTQAVKEDIKKQTEKSVFESGVNSIHDADEYHKKVMAQRAQLLKQGQGVTP